MPKGIYHDTSRPWTEDERERVALLRRDGMSLVCIASTLGRTRAAVKGQLERLALRRAADAINDPILRLAMCLPWRPTQEPTR